MVIGIEAHKIAYMALPKAACTSVKAALSQCDPEVTISLQELKADPYLIHGTYQTKRFRPQRWQTYKGWWRFTVVRDPIKRLLSVYSDLVAGRNEIRNSRRLRRADSPLPVDPDPDFFYQHLKEYRSASSAVKHHVLPAWLFIGPKPHRYDRVYRIEDLSELAVDLSERTGEKVTIPHFNKASSKLKFDDLAPKTRASLEEYLRVEYNSLSEYYQCPL